MQRMHNHELLEKERKLQIRLEEQKTEVAVYWEERLLQECGRLKTELEQIYFEERRAALLTVKGEKEEEILELKQEWEGKIRDYLEEVRFCD